ncbi:hypothetical protein KIPB_009541 [Kipferlia bialata]|uniref:Reverse transcriptase domain-containing protein n=1 Tax=Kipferlia bialata TaxID=797122 RepID=A0A9K3GKU8_9EUKA|nr:hypothetical protein KIPB_009541 [Kipferlia bialata]|eukprot:g9541.t1
MPIAPGSVDPDETVFDPDSSSAQLSPAVVDQLMQMFAGLTQKIDSQAEGFQRTVDMQNRLMSDRIESMETRMTTQINTAVSQAKPPLTTAPLPQVLAQYLTSANKAASTSIDDMSRLLLIILQDLDEGGHDDPDVVELITHSFHSLHLALAAPLDRLRVWPLAQSLMDSEVREWTKVIDKEVLAHGIKPRGGRRNQNRNQNRNNNQAKGDNKGKGNGKGGSAAPFSPETSVSVSLPLPPSAVSASATPVATVSAVHSVPAEPAVSAVPSVPAETAAAPDTADSITASVDAPVSKHPDPVLPSTSLGILTPELAVSPVPDAAMLTFSDSPAPMPFRPPPPPFSGGRPTPPTGIGTRLRFGAICARGSMSRAWRGWLKLGVSRKMAKWLKDGPPMFVPKTAFTKVPMSLIRSQELADEIEEYLSAGCYELGSYVAGGPLFGVPRNVGRVRVIHDLSLLNRHVYPPVYKLWAVRRAVMRLRKGQFISVLDLKSGYSQVLLAPKVRKFFGALLPDGRRIRARTLCFGASSSPYIFQRITATFARYVEHVTGVMCLAYIDDFLLASSSRKSLLAALHLIRALAPVLGLVWGAKSQWEPCQRAAYLGLILCTATGRLYVPAEKAQIILAKVSVLLSRRRVRRKEILSLAGSIGYLRPAFPQCLLRLRALQSQSRGGGRVTLNAKSKAALKWFRQRLSAPTLPSAPFILPRSPFWISTDATLHDYGAVLWHRGVRVSSLSARFQTQAAHIMISEGLALLYALRHWQDRVRGHTILWLCDNKATLAIVGKGSTKAPDAIVADWQLDHGVSLVGRYVQSALNYDADALSRPLAPPPQPLPHWHRLVARFGHPQVMWDKVCRSLLAQLEGGPPGRPWRDRKTLWYQSPSTILPLLSLLERWFFPSAAGRPTFAEDPSTVIVVVPRWESAHYTHTLTHMACIKETFRVPEGFTLPWSLDRAFSAQGEQGAAPKLTVYGIRVRRHSGSARSLPGML